MPWTPIKYFPKIFDNLKRRGYTKQVTLAIMEQEIIKETGLVRDATIRNVVVIMEKLGYIKLNPTGVLDILYWNQNMTDEEIKHMKEESLMEQLMPTKRID